MANKIQFKRGVKASLPMLSVGEPAFTTDTGGLYVGSSGGNIKYGREIYFNVKDFGAKGDGINDDTTPIQNAINAAKAAGGGIVFIPKGKYVVTATLTIDANVSIEGCGSDVSNLDIEYPLTKSVSGIQWLGGAYPVISMIGRLGSTFYRDFAIDGNGDATIGISIDRNTGSCFTNLRLSNFSQICLKLQCNGSGDVSNDNVAFNTFTGLSLIRASTPLYLGGNAHGNTCHNVFINTSIVYTGNPGLYMGDTDNNYFSMTFFYRRGGTGKTIEFTSLSRSNYFFHLQAGDVLARTGSKNTIFGYDRENGQSQPTLETGAQLTWTEDGNNSTGWYLSRPIYKLGNVTVGSGVTDDLEPEMTNFKVGNTQNGQKFAIDFDTVNRYTRFWHNAGNGLFNYMSADIYGVSHFMMGGVKHTYNYTIPTTGSHTRGEIVYNTLPTAGGNVGWVCVADGTPGTWKTFGSIQA